MSRNASQEHLTHGSQPNGSNGKSFWRETLDVITPAITAGGVLIFVLLRLYYNKFYGALGVSPNDIGLGYASTLASSVGFLFVGLAIALCPSIVVGSIYGAWYVTRTSESNLPSSFRDLLDQLRPGLLRIAKIAVPLATVAVLVLATVWFIERADYYSNIVKQGRAVKFRGVPFSSFVVRATPAEIRVISKDGENPGLEDLQSRSAKEPPLLYLGQANSAFIFYDSAMQQSIYVPASPVVLRLNNCQTLRTPNDACKNTVA